VCMGIAVGGDVWANARMFGTSGETGSRGATGCTGSGSVMMGGEGDMWEVRVSFSTRKGDSARAWSDPSCTWDVSC
jgi:hypothetical protein